MLWTACWCPSSKHPLGNHCSWAQLVCSTPGRSTAQQARGFSMARCGRVLALQFSAVKVGGATPCLAQGRLATPCPTQADQLSSRESLFPGAAVPSIQRFTSAILFA